MMNELIWGFVAWIPFLVLLGLICFNISVKVWLHNRRLSRRGYYIDIMEETSYYHGFYTTRYKGIIYMFQPKHIGIAGPIDKKVVYQTSYCSSKSKVYNELVNVIATL